MRRAVDAARVRALLEELGQLTREPTTVYLVGGASAVVEGWRSTTIDVDLRIEPERDELLRALPSIKERLKLNIELASPADFLPELPDWRERSPYVEQVGTVVVRHFDFYAQALAKLERNLGADRTDVEAMVVRGLVDPERLRTLLADVEPQLYRFPAVDGPALRAAVERLVARPPEARD
ncbi:MAG: hypothetical protein M3N29_09725 [Chloroflexota bacterium]|nr:hypothetical protein [Chloroflexota bacterium]